MEEDRRDGRLAGPDEALSEEAKEGRSSKNLLRRLLSFMLAALIGFAGGLYLSAGQEGALAWLGMTAKSETSGAAVTVGRIPDEAAGFYKIEGMIANVTRTTPGGRKINRYLKVSVTLVHAPEASLLVEEREDYLIDAYQAYLRQITPEEVEGSLGLMRLKAELLRRARAVVGEGQVRDVLLTELLIQ